MTSQTKHLIEPSDIIALRFECKHCHASLTVLAGDLENRNLQVCPNCKRGWALLSETSYEAAFSEFVAVLARLTHVLYGHGQLPPAPLGFTMTLEINSPESTE